MLFNKQFLQDATGGHWINASDTLTVKGIFQDSRTLSPGSLFVALKTGTRDGHDFVQTAQSAGAAAALVEHEVNGCDLPQLIVPDTLKAFQSIAAARRSRYRGKIIGITGSCGKTSTKDLLKLLLGNDSHATAKNLNNFIGVPLTLTSLEDSSPFGIIEAGISLSGEMEALADMITPDIAITTNVAPAHLEHLGSEENIAREKSVLSAHVQKENGLALFPASCLRFNVFSELPVPRVCLFRNGENMEGIRPGDFVFAVKQEEPNATVIELWLSGQRTQSEQYRVPRKGAGMIQNAALAIIAAKYSGIDRSSIETRLQDWKPSHYRGEWLADEKRTFFVDCYNANPVSVQESWQIFQKQSDPKLPRLYILGSMAELGNKSKELHEQSLQGLVLRPQDSALLVGESIDGYATALVNHGSKIAQIHFANKTDDAQSELDRFSGSVLIKGSRIHALEKLLSHYTLKAVF